MQRGYEAAESHRAELLPHALDDAAWQVWLRAREQRRHHPLPVPAYLSTAGVAPSDAVGVRRVLAAHVDKPLDLPSVEKDLSALSGLDRYQTVVWEMMGPPGKEGLLIHAKPKTYAPPFMMLGFNLENRTSSDFRVQMAARYLSFDVLGIRIGVADRRCIGSDPSVGFSLHRPIFGTADLCPSVCGGDLEHAGLHSGRSDRGPVQRAAAVHGRRRGRVPLSRERSIRRASIRTRRRNGAGRAIPDCRKRAAPKTSSGLTSSMMGRTAQSCPRAARRRS